MRCFSWIVLFSHQPNLHCAWRMCTSQSTGPMSLVCIFAEKKIYLFFKENTKVEVVWLQSPRKYRIITVNKGRCSNHHTYWISGYLSLSFSISWWQMTTHHSTHFQSSLKRYSSWDSDFSDKKILANQYVFNPLNYYNQFFHECMGYSIKNIFQYPLQLHEVVKHIYCFNTIQTINTAVITYLLGRGTTKREGKCETNLFKAFLGSDRKQLNFPYPNQSQD